MADKDSDLDFSDSPDELDYSEDSMTNSVSDQAKKDLNARRKLDELMEQKRLSKMLRDEFDEW